MESSPTTCNRKRKRSPVVDDTGSKKPKCGEKRENGLVSCSPEISVNPEHILNNITNNDLLELLHYAVVDKTKCRVHRPSWCLLHKQRLLTAVNVAVVDHVTQNDFYQHYLSMPNLRNKYNMRVALAPSSTNLLSDIFRSQVSVIHIPPNQTEKQERPQMHEAIRNHPIIRKFGTECRGMNAYLLSTDEMSRNNYPLTGRPGCEDFVRTNSDTVVTDSSPLFGLDCEMCLTDKGSELTRVSLVDSSGSCVLDQLVKPQNKIRNYLTEFSGVTRGMLSQVTTRLSDVQARVKSLLPRDAVLVGHSLNSDLQALKMIHPHVIDTSLLYRRRYGGRFKLKILAENLLQKQIQTGDRRGHDPCEDATAALELAQYFINKGPLKIVQELVDYTESEEVETRQQTQTEPTTLCWTQCRFVDVLQDSGRSVVFIGRRSNNGLHISKHQWFSSDKKVLQAFREQPECPFFSVLQFCPEHTDAAQRTQTRSLQELCVLFTGPLPPHFSKKDVKRLFRCCGPLHSIRIIHTGVRVHAEVQFQFPESTLLAMSALDGLTLHGHSIKVQRPVGENTLDAEVTVAALQTDPVTSRLLYVVGVSPDITELLQASTHTSGPSAETTKQTGSSGPVQVNSLKRQRPPELREDLLMDTFSRFGPVLQIIKPTHMGQNGTQAETGKRATHAYVEFKSAHSREAALNSSQDLLQLNYLLCSALIPPQHSVWMTPNCDTERSCITAKSPAAAWCLRKLDRRIGKLFRCLPENTLSVIILRGSHETPGLVFMEVKAAS